MKSLITIITGFILFSSCSTNDPSQEEWTNLFNGKDLSGWIIKTSKHPAGENYNNTVRVENGTLQMAYDEYTDFDGEFTHLFTEEKYSYYKLVVEYRFVGEQVTGGPGWAIRNSGAMIHAQSAASMSVDQPFPTSIEVQYLGGLGNGDRPTGNLCTPGTNVEMYEALCTQHCTNSDSKTYDGDQWVTVETIAHGHEQIWHIIEGDTVITYTHPQLDERDPLYADMLNYYGTKDIFEGHIALQGESSPVEFRSVKLLNLKGCMDPKAKNYKSYYIKEDNSLCKY